MKINITTERLDKVKTLLEMYEADTENFLNAMPTREKYAMLALVFMHNQGYEYYEEAYDAVTRKVNAQELTKYLMDYPFLWCHLQDIVQIVSRHGGWDAFQVVWVSHHEEKEED